MEFVNDEFDVIFKNIMNNISNIRDILISVNYRELPSIRQNTFKQELIQYLEQVNEEDKNLINYQNNDVYTLLNITQDQINKIILEIKIMLNWVNIQIPKIEFGTNHKTEFLNLLSTTLNSYEKIFIEYWNKYKEYSNEHSDALDKILIKSQKKINSKVVHNDAGKILKTENTVNISTISNQYQNNDINHITYIELNWYQLLIYHLHTCNEFYIDIYNTISKNRNL